MLFEKLETRQLLGRIIAHVSTDPACQDDLMQEGLIHLWQIEEQTPAQTLSWYLQSCRFRLRHYLAKGRSVDSWKRRQQRIAFSHQEDDEAGPPLPHTGNSTPMAETSARDMFRLLQQRLPALQQLVLACLADGLSSREVGLKLGVSHKTVINHRRKIATVALQLGIGPDYS